MAEKITWRYRKQQMKHMLELRTGSDWELLDKMIEDKKIEELINRDSYTIVIFRQACKEEDYKKLKNKYYLSSKDRIRERDHEFI